MSTDLYQGRRLSKFFGFAASLALVVGGFQLLMLRWGTAVVALFVSIATAYFAYQLAGGRRNPALVRKKPDVPDFGSVASSSESAQYDQSMLETMEKLYGNNYGGLIGRVYNAFARQSRGEVMLLPEALADALTEAHKNPCVETWGRLKDALLSTPRKA